MFCVFFFNDTATTEIYTLSLHDALPISPWAWLNCSLGEVLERALHVGEEPIRVSAVHHAVIVGHRYHAHGADRDRVGAVRQRHHLGALLDRADAEDRHLGLVDDRCARVRPEHARVRDREGAALDLVGRELLGPRALPQVVDRARQTAERQLVGALHDGHDEPPIERYRDPDVHIATVDDVVARDRGVHHRMFPQILGTRLRDEREVREIHAALGGGRLVLAAELGHTAVVDLEEARHVRRRTARHDHVIRGDLADLRKRLDPVTGPGLDDGVHDGARRRKRGGGGGAPAGGAAGAGRGARGAAAPAPTEGAGAGGWAGGGSAGGGGPLWFARAATSVWTGTVCPS